MHYMAATKPKTVKQVRKKYDEISILIIGIKDLQLQTLKGLPIIGTIL